MARTDRLARACRSRPWSAGPLHPHSTPSFHPWPKPPLYIYFPNAKNGRSLLLSRRISPPNPTHPLCLSSSTIRRDHFLPFRTPPTCPPQRPQPSSAPKPSSLPNPTPPKHSAPPKSSAPSHPPPFATAWVSQAGSGATSCLSSGRCVLR